MIDKGNIHELGQSPQYEASDPSVIDITRQKNPSMSRPIIFNDAPLAPKMPTDLFLIFESNATPLLGGKYTLPTVCRRVIGRDIKELCIVGMGVIFSTEGGVFQPLTIEIPRSRW
jgi:hypothetical protein